MSTESRSSSSTKFPSFPGCKFCFRKPCDRLRFGGVFPNKFKVVYGSDVASFGCPFLVTSLDEVVQLFRESSQWDLIRFINDIMWDMSIADQNNFRQEHYVDGYLDFNGRINYLCALWNARVMAIVRVPPAYRLDRQLAQWLLAYESLDLQVVNQPAPETDDSPAVTDSMTSQPEQTTSTHAPVEKGSYHIRLNIDPNDPDSKNDTFTLYSTDGAKTYNKVLTVQDDQIPGDSYTDLSFMDLDITLSYSLKIDFGNGGQSYLYIENKPYGEMHG